jgi:hypothetical protein
MMKLMVAKTFLGYRDEWSRFGLLSILLDVLNDEDAPTEGGGV